jgi:hypothetical protein
VNQWQEQFKIYEKWYGLEFPNGSLGSSYISLPSELKSQKKRMLTKRFEQQLLKASNRSKTAGLPTLALSTAFSYRKSE